jgi:hypothetical protein
VTHSLTLLTEHSYGSQSFIGTMLG